MNIYKLSNKSKGIVFIILSAFGFAIMSAFIKLSGDLPSFQKTFFRNIVAVIVAFILIYNNKESYLGKKENQRTLLLRSFFGTLGIICNYYAIDRMVLSDASILNKLSPFFAIIFSWLIIKEKASLRQMTLVTIAFLGALFIIKPSFNSEILPSLIGTMGGMCAGLAYTYIRKLSTKEAPNTIVFYFSLFSSMVTFPLMLVYYTPMELMQLVYLILAGIFASLGQFSITRAYKYAPAKEISIFDYTNIVFSALISLLLFGILPDYLSVIGYIIIFTVSLYMVKGNRKSVTA